MALDYEKGLLGLGQGRIFRGISGEPFSGRVTRREETVPGAVRVEVGGMAYYAGRGTFVIEPDDPLGFGFDLARHFADRRG